MKMAKRDFDYSSFVDEINTILDEDECEEEENIQDQNTINSLANVVGDWKIQFQEIQF